MLESAYLSKRLDVHPDNLAEVAARWHRGLEPLRWSSRLVRVGTGFWLASNARARIVAPHTAYEVRGVMWIGGRPVPLILEFAGWSKTQSELGMCPGSLSWPVGTDRYVRRVRAALEDMSQALSSSTPQVVAAQPERATDRSFVVTELRHPFPEPSPVVRAAFLSESDRAARCENVRAPFPILAQR
jgi:hypothetical protein